VGTILVAAGGGGDAITAAALPTPLSLGEPVVIMTYSWDRLMIDPIPGPRSVQDFTGLGQPAANVWEVSPHTRPIPPAGSSLPRLASHLPGRLILLDPSAGALGMAEQITAAAKEFGADSLTIIDVGGDALTNGQDPGLRSPLADQLAIAACLRSGLSARLIVAAPGVDGEIDPVTLRHRLKELHSQRLPTLTGEQLDPVRRVFEWHPSEASGLLLAAADGHRGYVQVRDAGDQIALTDDTANLYSLDLDEIRPHIPASDLIDTASLKDAEATVERITGVSELRYETQKAAHRNGSPVHTVTDADLDQVDHHAGQASDQGADYISMRRLSELVGATTLEGFAALGQLLAHYRADRYAPSIYRVNCR
jgi:hypothetical protein